MDNMTILAQMAHAQQLGERLRALRLAAGYRTQNDLGTASGVPQCMISTYETGERPLDNIRIRTALRLVRALGITLDTLYGANNGI